MEDAEANFFAAARGIGAKIKKQNSSLGLSKNMDIKQVITQALKDTENSLRVRTGAFLPVFFFLAVKFFQSC